MDLSQEPSKDESRIMDRQLYRAGQTKTAAKSSPATPARSIAKPSMPPPKRSSLAKGDQTPLLQRRLVRAVLAALWLLLLGGASYCVFLPDPIDEARREMRTVFRDKNLTREERREKMGQIMSGLSDRQRMNVFMSPERRVKIHDDMDAFFKLSPQQQAEQLKKEILEREKWRAEMRAKWAANGGGRGPWGGPKGGAPGKGAPGKGGPRGGGPGWGGGGRGGGDPTGGDMFPPETREQMGVKRDMSRDMSKQMGINSGRGGRGGPPGGGRGGRPQ